MGIIAEMHEALGKKKDNTLGDDRGQQYATYLDKNLVI